jgi:hypothetical protein
MAVRKQEEIIVMGKVLHEVGSMDTKRICNDDNAFVCGRD